MPIIPALGSQRQVDLLSSRIARLHREMLSQNNKKANQNVFCIAFALLSEMWTLYGTVDRRTSVKVS